MYANNSSRMFIFCTEIILHLKINLILLYRSVSIITFVHYCHLEVLACTNVLIGKTLIVNIVNTFKI